MQSNTSSAADLPGQHPENDPTRRELNQSPCGNLRLLTYNVHNCKGTDGRLSPQRIAQVIAHSQPDIVALQELDQGRARTGFVDQAHQIAHHLQMEFHFHAALELEQGRYGNAILTHLPVRLIKADRLPEITGRRPFLEPRGAVWVSVDTLQGVELQIINTHLGLSGKERRRQVKALLGNQWLRHPQCQGPVILCGDFNAVAYSWAYRQFSQYLQDAQRRLAGHRPKATFPARYPLLRLDHVFVDDTLKIVNVEVAKTAMSRLASDHLPLLVEIQIGD